MKNLFRTVMVLALFSFGFAHDPWLECDSFVVKAGQKTVIRNGNGYIYIESENAVTPGRIAQLVAIGPEGRKFEPNTPYVHEKWLQLDFTPDASGNYWFGIATEPRSIRLAGEDFTEYLKHSGVENVLKDRAAKGITDRDEIEEYSKYVKTYLQVDDTHSSNYDKPLGLVIDTIPLKNPYSLTAGDSLPVQVLFKGKPLAGLILYAGAAGHEKPLTHATTDNDGKAEIKLSQAGRWYIRGINLLQVDEKDHSYESYWTTLTFEVRK
jgi:uncharacterized GH25 family protein